VAGAQRQRRLSLLLRREDTSTSSGFQQAAYRAAFHTDYGALCEMNIEHINSTGGKGPITLPYVDR
jgi:hypothetical protein